MGYIDKKTCEVNFGSFISEKRKRQNVYQDEIAKQLGITQAQYSYLESGKRSVDLATALQICQILNIDFNDFVKTQI